MLCLSKIEFHTPSLESLEPLESRNTEKGGTGHVQENLHCTDIESVAMDNGKHASSIGNEGDSTCANTQQYGPVSGQLISTMTKACRDCFHSQHLSRRLVEGEVYL